MGRWGGILTRESACPYRGLAINIIIGINNARVYLLPRALCLDVNQEVMMYFISPGEIGLWSAGMHQIGHYAAILDVLLEEPWGRIVMEEASGDRKG